jgi:lysophospholipase L1-like esterase
MNALVTTFRRYVAIGDSTTEGLEDPDPRGGYRGWADRLAQHIADAQDEPLEYANLAIRGLRMREIRTAQLDDALAMRPDLLTIFGGMNDVIAPRCDFDAIRADYVIAFGEARRAGCTVLTFTMPDPTTINPLGWRLRERVSRLNDIIRSEGEARRVLVMDFDAYPAASDPRLWYEDRLHGNTIGHTKAAAAMAWRLGVDGFDDSWAHPLDGEQPQTGPRVAITGDMDWAVHYLLPWLGKGVRRLPRGFGIPRKRPVPTVVPKSRPRVA